MDVPTGIISFGNQQFSDWLKGHVERSEAFSYSGDCEQIDVIQSLVSKEKPRTVIVDLSGVDSNKAGLVGGEAQRGFKWTTVLFVFESLDESLLGFSRSVRRRRWSLVGKEMIDDVGIDRVLAGTLTDSGFIDSSVSAFETELYEQSLESAEKGDSSGEDEDEMDEAV